MMNEREKDLGHIVTIVSRENENMFLVKMVK